MQKPIIVKSIVVIYPDGYKTQVQKNHEEWTKWYEKFKEATDDQLKLTAKVLGIPFNFQ